MCLGVAVVLVVLLQGCGGGGAKGVTASAAEGATGATNQVDEYYLTRVQIPPASRHRNGDDPPDLYVVLHENGSEVASSTVQCGWEVEFPREEQNRFRVSAGASYALYLRDQDYLSPDEDVVQVVELSAENFKGRIFESLGKHDSQDRAVTFDFKRIEADSEKK